MKKHILLLIFISLCCFSCDDDDNAGSGSIGPVSNVTSTSFIGSVILNWTNPTDDNLYYVLVSYTNSAGETVHKKVDKYSLNTEGRAESTVGGFTDTNEHQFTLTAYNYTGGYSSSVTVSGTPQGRESAMDYVIETVTMEGASSAAQIAWTNESGVGVNLIVTYTDYKDVEQTETINATSSGQRTLSGTITETTDFHVVAVNIEDGATSEEKVFSITPEVDPNDIIYDDIDYITFGSGANQLTYSQDNPDNPYEYTFVTTGGDPYINCNGLNQAIAGTTLVFRYKSTAAFTLELFWCDAGGGAAGGRSTAVSVPANNTGLWQTFEYDYSSDMTTHSWAGGVGDFARFDWGSNSDVTINVKNIHFE